MIDRSTNVRRALRQRQRGFIINPFRFGGGGGGGGGVTAWDPANTAASITLSGGNRTATGNANSGGIAKSLSSKSTGKWYAEVKNTAYSSAGTNGCGMIGIVTSGETLTNYLGQGSGCAGIWRVGASSVRSYFAAAETIHSGTAATNDVYMLAWDADAGLVWFGRNGTWVGSGNPAAGTGATHSGSSLQGTHFLATGPRNNANATVLQTTLSYSPPSGFSVWT